MSFSRYSEGDTLVPSFLRKDTLDMRGGKKRQSSDSAPIYSELQLLVKIQSIKRNYDSFTLSF